MAAATVVKSLQSISTISIAQNIGEYSIPYISFLPAHLRRDLLALLPAIDICKLEKTSVAAGVCLREVWEYVWSSRKKMFYVYRPFTYSIGQDLMEVKERWWRVQESAWEGEKVDMIEKPTGRDAYFSALTCCLLTDCSEGYVDPQRDALKALFFVPELGNPIPSNLVYSRFELLRMLVEYRCQPLQLQLSCASFMELGFWDRKGEVFSLLSALFSRVSHLAISEHETDYIGGDDPNSKQLSHVFRFLLEAVFCDSKNRPTVTRFNVNADDDAFLVRALHHMADIMSPKSSCGNFTHNLYTHYNGLRLIAISIFREGEAVASLRDANIDLRMVIEHQTALHTLYIQGLSACNQITSPEYDQLMHCFGNLFRKPTFFKLGLFSFRFLHSSGNNTLCFEGIMHKFLCSPIRGQEFELSSIWKLSLERCGSSPVSLLDQPPSTVIGSKSLQFVQDVGDDLEWFNPFFSRRLPVFPLWTLGYLYLEDMSNVTEDALAAITTLNLTALHFQSCCLSEVVPSIITQLVIMPNLTSLVLRCAILSAQATITEQFMEAVTQGLLQQASFAKITFLDLSFNVLAKTSNRHLQEFFNAIFNLPQLESLTLFLRMNGFTDSHVQLLCQSWREEAGCQRLLELDICQQFLPHLDRGKMLYVCTPEPKILAVTVQCTCNFNDVSP